jgi:hypothetical protein
MKGEADMYYYLKADLLGRGGYWKLFLTAELKVDLNQAVQLSSSSWTKAVNHTYFHTYKGEWFPNAYLTWGKAVVRYSAEKIVKRNNISEGELIEQIEEMFIADPSMSWKNDEVISNIVVP